MVGALVSILNVSDFHDSRTPALSVARYSNVGVPLTVIVATVSYVWVVPPLTRQLIDFTPAIASLEVSVTVPAVDVEVALVTGGVPSTVNEPARLAVGLPQASLPRTVHV